VVVVVDTAALVDWVAVVTTGFTFTAFAFTVAFVAACVVDLTPRFTCENPTTDKRTVRVRAIVFCIVFIDDRFLINKNFN
jgi:hypothetical protein